MSWWCRLTADGPKGDKIMYDKQNKFVHKLISYNVSVFRKEKQTCLLPYSPPCFHAVYRKDSSQLFRHQQLTVHTWRVLCGCGSRLRNIFK